MPFDAIGCAPFRFYVDGTVSLDSVVFIYDAIVAFHLGANFVFGNNDTRMVVPFRSIGGVVSIELICAILLGWLSRVIRLTAVARFAQKWTGLYRIPLD